MFRFAHPEVLIWLWLVPAFLIGQWLVARRAQTVLHRQFSQRTESVLLHSHSPARRRWKAVFRGLSLLFAIIAWAQPQMGKSSTQIKSEGVEIVFVVDVSSSMLAEDVKPSRLEHAKSELSRLADLLSGDKVGLIAFAGSAVVAAPLTTDKSAIQMLLEGLSVRSVESQGTDVHKALLAAREVFERGGADPDEGARVTRVILLASDGEDHEAGAIEEAKKMVNDGYRIFSIAFGSEKGAPIPMRDERGFLTGYKHDKGGQNVMSAVKGDFLRELAKIGQGGFYYASFGGNEAKQVRDDLDRLQKAEFASEIAAAYDEKFQIFLTLALFFAWAELLLAERKSGKVRWRGRFEVGVVGLLLALMIPAGSEASELSGIWRNNSGVKDFKDEKAGEAHEKFAKSLSDLPFEAAVHFNLGTTFLARKEYEKALQELRTTGELAKDNPTLQFLSYFNAAHAATAMKKVDQALQLYQEALALAPDSKEVKTNIELLTQQQQGKGQGDGEPNQDPNDQDQSGSGQAPPKQSQGQQPKPYQGKDLSEQDVKKILEELKQQDQEVRARYQREKVKESPKEKDW